MANARKCDRCGTCFDPLGSEGEMARFRNPIFQTSSDIMENVRGHLLVGAAGPDGIIDLCPKCTDQFWAFMYDVPVFHRANKFDIDPGADLDGDEDEDPIGQLTIDQEKRGSVTRKPIESFNANMDEVIKLAKKVMTKPYKPPKEDTDGDK